MFWETTALKNFANLFFLSDTGTRTFLAFTFTLFEQASTFKASSLRTFRAILLFGVAVKLFLTRFAYADFLKLQFRHTCIHFHYGLQMKKAAQKERPGKVSWA